MEIKGDLTSRVISEIAKEDSSFIPLKEKAKGLSDNICFSVTSAVSMQLTEKGYVLTSDVNYFVKDIIEGEIIKPRNIQKSFISGQIIFVSSNNPKLLKRSENIDKSYSCIYRMPTIAAIFTEVKDIKFFNTDKNKWFVCIREDADTTKLLKDLSNIAKIHGKTIKCSIVDSLEIFKGYNNNIFSK